MNYAFSWFIFFYNRPGYTVEVGLGESPLPLTQFEKIYSDNLSMKELFLPDLEILDRYFLYKNVILEKAILLKVKKTGYNFMFCNEKLYYLDMRSLVETGDNFLPNNLDLNYVDFSNLKVMGENFFGKNVKIRNLTDINNKKNILRDMRKKLLDFDFHKKYEYVKKR